MVKVQVAEQCYYLDGFLKTNLDAVKISVVRRDYDSFLVLTGREGFGKSTFAFQVAKYLDPTFDLDRCVFSIEQFEEAAIGAKKHQAIVFDETMGYLSSRGAMSSFNKRLIKIMAEMRSKNLFVILCIPNFFELDRYPAIHRTTGLLHIYKRGYFGSYDYNTKKKLYLTGKKYYSYNISPNFIGRFVKYFVLPKEEYERKKQQAIAKWVSVSDKHKHYMDQRNILIRELYKTGKYTMRQIADLLFVGDTTVNRVISIEK